MGEDDRDFEVFERKRKERRMLSITSVAIRVSAL